MPRANGAAVSAGMIIMRRCIIEATVAVALLAAALGLGLLIGTVLH
jgi:hypothetical protein